MIVADLQAFLTVTAASPEEVVADVETYGSDPEAGKLLGVALSWAGQAEGIYVPVWQYSLLESQFKPQGTPELHAALKAFLLSKKLVGWNIEYDRHWLDCFTRGQTTWVRDVRCMWYLLDREQVERGYSLESAEKKLLRWLNTNKAEMADVVKKLGGTPGADIYLAPLPQTAKYACLDVKATLECDQLLTPEFNRLNYWFYLTWLQDYGKFLAQATRDGVAVDHLTLARARKHYIDELKRLESEIRLVCKPEIDSLEQAWFHSHLTSLSQPHAIENWKRDSHRWPKFNIRSGPQRARLFHELLGFPVLETTETGKPKTDRATYEKINHPAAKLFVTVSETTKNLDGFVEGYLDSVKNGRIHFAHNWCATVTGRLGGFKPYDLNMPFSEERIMRAFGVEKGWTGIHMDFKSLEPTVIAAYSQDPTLTRLYRDGLGDVYLELCLEIFPLHEAGHYSAELAEQIRFLHANYDPNKVTDDKLKKAVKGLRNVAKIVHLAVGYTGTEYTVSENLTKARFPTSLAQAKIMVNRYWAKYIAVKQFEEKLQALYDKQGYIRSVNGAYIWVPKKFRKDLMNRFVQRSGHEILVCFVMELYRGAAERGLTLKPVLPDTHDATSAKCPDSQIEACKTLFNETLDTINTKLGWPIKLGMEVKTYHTLFGLKNDES